MEKFISELAAAHFEADRHDFINFISRSFKLNGDDITDIYNEVWIDVINNVSRGRTERVVNWKSYIFGLGWKRAYKLVTRRAKILRICDDEYRCPDYDAANLRNMEDDRLHLEHLERIEVMMMELEQMPEKQREMLTLFYMNGKSTAEVSEAMGYSGPRSVITLKKRSVDMLKQRMMAVA